VALSGFQNGGATSHGILKQNPRSRGRRHVRAGGSGWARSSAIDLTSGKRGSIKRKDDPRTTDRRLCVRCPHAACETTAAVALWKTRSSLLPPTDPVAAHRHFSFAAPRRCHGRNWPELAAPRWCVPLPMERMPKIACPVLDGGVSGIIRRAHHHEILILRRTLSWSPWGVPHPAFAPATAGTAMQPLSATVNFPCRTRALPLLHLAAESGPNNSKMHCPRSRFPSHTPPHTHPKIPVLHRRIRRITLLGPPRGSNPFGCQRRDLRLRVCRNAGSWSRHCTPNSARVMTWVYLGTKI